MQINNFPCDTSLRNKGQKLLELLAHENIALQKLELDLKNIVKSAPAAGISESEIIEAIKVYERNSSKNSIN